MIYLCLHDKFLEQDVLGDVFEQEKVKSEW